MTYYCYEGSRKQINDEIYYRNIPSSNLQMVFSPRGVETRHIQMPIVDCRKPSTYVIKKESIYNTQKTFNPASDAPYSGYADNVDRESTLYNIFFPLQQGIQGKFIPESSSDLYHHSVYVNRPMSIKHAGLFYREKFAPKNANPCNLGQKLFNNHTRLQVKNLKTTS